MRAGGYYYYWMKKYYSQNHHFPCPSQPVLAKDVANFSQTFIVIFGEQSLEHTEH